MTAPGGSSSPGRSWPRRTAGDDNGAATAQLVIATPLLLFLLLLTVQFSLWWQAVHLAQVTASQALAATRASNGSTAAGRAQADTILAQLGNGLLLDPKVDVTRGGGQARAQVSGTAAMVVPGLNLPVQAVAAGPVDAWSTP